MGNQGNIIFGKYHKKALSCIEEGKNLFITGKTGTGKTTLLREITTVQRNFPIESTDHHRSFSSYVLV